MNASQENENAQPSLNAYFQNSSDPDIFDQISKHHSSNPDDDQKLCHGTDSSDPVAEKDGNEANQQPVICRIFSSDDSTVDCDKKASDGTFFDMLGCNVKYQAVTSAMPDTLKINKPPSYNSIISPELPSDASFFSPSSGTDVDSDVVNDELFMTGISSITGAKNVELDRRRDAWIPSNRTRQALVAAATAAPGTYILDKELSTMPGVVLQEDMIDNVHEAVNHYLGEVEAAERNVLTLNDVTQDERGLRELIQADCYRAAVNLTSRLLSMYGQGIGRAGYPSKHTLHSIQLWFTRIALLVKLRSWSVAWAESEPWWDLDKPDLYFQFYSELYGGRPGTIVPFSFRLLLAELPQYVHKPQEALKRLFSTLSVVRKIINNLCSGLSEDGSHFEISEPDRTESKKLWRSRETRALHSIVNVAFQQKDFRLAVNIMQELIDNPHVEYSVHHRRALLSAMGRMYLQISDLKTASVWFEKSRSAKASSNQGKLSSPDFQELVDSGLLAMTDGKFDVAHEYFQKASSKDPTNLAIKNNMAVCLLYCGKQKEAVTLLEAVITSNPTAGLHENLLLNLCTLYELESSSSLENKYKMLRMVAKYKGDAISLHCLKLQAKE